MVSLVVLPMLKSPSHEGFELFYLWISDTLDGTFGVTQLLSLRFFPRNLKLFPGLKALVTRWCSLPEIIESSSYNEPIING